MHTQLRNILLATREVDMFTKICASLVALLIFNTCHADLITHLRKNTGERPSASSIKNIDCIYLINLDQRPEKLEYSLSQFEPYGIVPYRFPAIYGWDLEATVFDDIGLKFLPGMRNAEWVAHFPPNGNGTPEKEFLRTACHNKNVFFITISPGAIGCTLSHLSVLQEALDAGYETIWILEDDLSIKQDPHLLSTLIDKLDTLVGKDEWDILYTDKDVAQVEHYRQVDFWRPDMNLSVEALRKRDPVGEDFVSIGSRFRTHSMLIRRSGMQKILNFAKEKRVFLPYDLEIAMIPDLKMFSLQSDVVTFGASVSDTKSNQFGKRTTWQQYKEKTLSAQSEIFGSCSKAVASQLMEFIHQEKPNLCVEIGALGGSTTYPIAKTLSFLKQGILYAIDGWDNEIAIEHINNTEFINWWKNANLEKIHTQFKQLIYHTQLENYCSPVRKHSKLAVLLFSDESIDFLYIDGNPSEQGSLEDTHLYFPKVKEGGYIFLNGANLLSKRPTVAFLMETCDWHKEKSVGTNCILFQKKLSPEKSSPVNGSNKQTSNT